jgi:hypothetical protein
MQQAHGGPSPLALHCRAAASYLDCRRKDQAMLNLFKSLIHSGPEKSIAERERAYLNASVSRIDLERREREVESGLFRHPHPYY